MQTLPIKVAKTDKGIECTFRCFSCGTEFTMMITFEEYVKRFDLDLKIQIAMPSRSAGFRERFMQSMCETCHKELYKFEEDEHLPNMRR